MMGPNQSLTEIPFFPEEGAGSFSPLGGPGLDSESYEYPTAKNQYPLPIQDAIPDWLRSQIDALEYRLLEPEEVARKLDRAWLRCQEQKHKSPISEAYLKAYSPQFARVSESIVRSPPFARTHRQHIVWDEKAELKPPPSLLIDASKRVKRVGGAATIGRRTAMEDAALATSFYFRTALGRKKATIVAIFDGHGGAETAQYASKHFAKFLKPRLEEYGLSGIENALTIACVDVSRTTPCTKSGSTATIALRMGKMLWVANINDSRGILVTKCGRTVVLSRDASLLDPHDVKKVQKRGCDVLFHGDEIPHVVCKPEIEEEIGHSPELVDSPSALGENCLGCTARPEIIKYELSPGDTVIIASDGLWDVATSEQVGHLTHQLQKKKQQTECETACAIITSAYYSRSQDNISALVMRV